jgi:hypothetical protein
MNFFLKASANEVVPLLRRMEAAVGEGMTVQEAYAAALHDTRVLKHVVGEPAPDLPFGAAVLQGLRRSKVRPLAELANVLQGDGGQDATTADAARERRQTQLRLGLAALGLLVALRLLRR